MARGEDGLPVDGFADFTAESDGLVREPGYEFFDGVVDDITFLVVGRVVVEGEFRETLLDVWEARRVNVVRGDARIPVDAAISTLCVERKKEGNIYK